MGSFRTKRGTCYISNSELRLDESYTGQVTRYYEGAKSSKLGFLLVAAVVIYLPLKFIDIVLNDWRELPYLLGFIAIIVVLVYTIDHVRGFRRVGTIPLDAITEAKVVEGSWWTHPRFIVKYEDDGQTENRRIRLPSRYFAFTEQEFEHAKKLFESHDIPLTGDSSYSENGQSPSSERA